jgi:hypothetical protein
MDYTARLWPELSKFCAQKACVVQNSGFSVGWPFKLRLQKLDFAYFSEKFQLKITQLLL